MKMSRKGFLGALFGGAAAAAGAVLRKPTDAKHLPSVGDKDWSTEPFDPYCYTSTDGATLQVTYVIEDGVVTSEQFAWFTSATDAAGYTRPGRAA